MGRIKQTSLKRVAKELLKEYDAEFSSEFETNKKAVGQFSTVQSKSVRNKIAGYITRVKKQNQVA
ncbi:MAG: 30S ribosomal protein S17e [Candidatus Altiarchaeales archaeon IMC4]|nr:MAG: 30S ribosomal protein S17e [Candidatus Altiarchaeales archaeon IMC4]